MVYLSRWQGKIISRALNSSFSVLYPNFATLYCQKNHLKSIPIKDDLGGDFLSSHFTLKEHTGLISSIITFYAIFKSVSIVLWQKLPKS